MYMALLSYRNKTETLNVNEYNWNCRLRTLDLDSFLKTKHSVLDPQTSVRTKISVLN